MMQSVYPTFFTITDTNVLVDCPDVGILTEGKDLYHAVLMARDAISLQLITLEDEGVIAPKPSDYITVFDKGSTFHQEGRTILSLVDVDTDAYREAVS